MPWHSGMRPPALAMLHRPRMQQLQLQQQARGLVCDDMDPAVVLCHRVPDAAASSADAATSTAAGWVLLSVGLSFRSQASSLQNGL